MHKCTLCLINDADKTGSHVVPHFLMKMIDNADHLKGRDKELGFKITEDFVAPYFGRDVNTSKLDQVFGEITDDDIANARSEVIADYIYCTSCEKNLGYLESLYAPTLKKTSNTIYESMQSYPAFLFWTSVVWRLSAYGKLGFKLAQKEENRLRTILKKHLDGDTQEVLDIAKDSCYTVLRAPLFSEKKESAAFYHPYHRFPYCLLFGEYVLFYYMKSSHIKNPEQSFFGLEKHLKEAPINTISQGEQIYPLREESMKEAWNNFISFVNEKRIKGLYRILDELHLKMGGEGKQMHPKVKYDILNDIMQDGKRIGRTFTRDDLIASTIKVLAKNYGFNPNAGSDF